MDHAGAWTEKKKDGSKGGMRLNVIKIGPFLCVAHFCGDCPSGLPAFGWPLGGGLFCTEPFALYCGPMCLVPNSDGTISDGCGVTYAKDEPSSSPQGAPMGSAEMER